MVFFPHYSCNNLNQAKLSTSLAAALALLFFCSGISALIYQVLWLRLLGLIFGATAYAASTVWGSFMAELALGSFGAGRIADRVRRPYELRAFVGPGPILTDDQPLVEYFLSLPRDRDPDFSKMKKGDFSRLLLSTDKN